MSEMIERVAKAIFDTMDVTDGLDGSAAERYARAAIEAMRESTQAMDDAGAIYSDCNGAPRTWEAMIDEALREKVGA
jgi:hypothetical protein